MPQSKSPADDNESEKCHLGCIIVRDLSCVVSNYRSAKTLDQYCKEQNVIGIADVDTRALTKVLRSYGCLVGVVTTDASKSTEELVKVRGELATACFPGYSCGRTDCVCGRRAQCCAKRVCGTMTASGAWNQRG